MLESPTNVSVISMCYMPYFGINIQIVVRYSFKTGACSTNIKKRFGPKNHPLKIILDFAKFQCILIALLNAMRHRYTMDVRNRVGNLVHVQTLL